MDKWWKEAWLPPEQLRACDSENTGRTYTEDPVVNLFLIGFDGFFVENMIFEINLNDTELHIGVDLK